MFRAAKNRYIRLYDEEMKKFLLFHAIRKKNSIRICKSKLDNKY